MQIIAAVTSNMADASTTAFPLFTLVAAFIGAAISPTLAQLFAIFARKNQTERTRAMVLPVLKSLGHFVERCRNVCPPDLTPDWLDMKTEMQLLTQICESPALSLSLKPKQISALLESYTGCVRFLRDVRSVNGFESQHGSYFRTDEDGEHIGSVDAATVLAPILRNAVALFE